MTKFLLAAVLVFSFLPAFSQNDSLKTIEMEGLIIRENRFEIPFAESSRNISVVEKEEIQRSIAQSIPEILSFIPGIDIRQRGPLGAQADISIRGGSFEQTLILINGIKMADPQTGHHSLNLPLHMDNIERIEALKGPGARIFGQNAFNGAVNFITRVPKDKALYLSAHGGDFGLYGVLAAVSLPDSDYKQYLSLSRDAATGYRHNTDFEINNLFYQAEWDVHNGQVNIIGGIADRRFGANGFYASPAYTEQYEEVTTGFISTGYSGNLGSILFKPRVYWRNNHDDYFISRENPSSYRNDHFTNVFGAETNLSFESALGETGLGIELRSEMIAGDWERGGVKSKSNLDGFHREKMGVYAEHKFALLDKSLHITPGIFISSYTDFGINHFPGVDVGYSPVKNFRLYANVGRSYRVPTFYDQYYVSATEEGNPNLKPETAVSYEAGFRYTFNGIAIESNYFRQNATQIIDWVMNEEEDKWRAENFSDILTEGVETSININFAESIGDEFFINHIFLSFNHIDSEHRLEADILSRYALENLQNQFIAGLNHKLLKRLTNTARVRMNKRVNKPSYWVWDLKLSYELKGFNIFTEATNLFNAEYEEVMTPMPGRWFRAGASYKFLL